MSKEHRDVVVSRSPDHLAAEQAFFLAFLFFPRTGERLSVRGSTEAQFTRQPCAASGNQSAQIASALARTPARKLHENPVRNFSG